MSINQTILGFTAREMLFDPASCWIGNELVCNYWDDAHKKNDCFAVIFIDHFRSIILSGQRYLM